MATDKRKEKKVTAKIQGVGVRLKWNVPENIITRFASNIVVQLIENEFKISFFEINPDIRLGIENKIPTEVKANCVASIIVTAERLPAFIEVLQRQINMYLQLKSNSELSVLSNEP